MCRRGTLASNGPAVCSVALCRGGKSFCRHAAEKECIFRYKNVAVAKTMTPGGSAPRQRGQPAGFCQAALAAQPGR